MASSDLHNRPGEFQAALEFTAAKTGFSSYLIEKDYWCSLVLRELFLADGHGLVFKGGTLLSKAYAGFNRLSEDLDFMLPTHSRVGRGERRKRADVVEVTVATVAERLGLKWKEPWRGHNESTQYTGRLTYPSILGGADGILIEVAQREELIMPAAKVYLETLLRDPLFSEPVIPAVTVQALNVEEAYAEKLRAALTRHPPAIRDLFDLWKGKLAQLVPMHERDWLLMVRRKCLGLDLSRACADGRRDQFARSLLTDLKPVLRSGALDEFPFSDAWALMMDFHRRLLALPSLEHESREP